MSYTHLSERERVIISTLYDEWFSQSHIARSLWRNRSTISRELKRNRTRWLIYDPIKAHHKACLRIHIKKKACMKIRRHRYIEHLMHKLLLWWRSPEQIVLRLNKEYQYMLSPSTVRRYINSKYSYGLKQELLEMQLLKKYKTRSSKKSKSRIQNRVTIDERPDYASNPKATWHYECDFIESCLWDKTVILTLIDKWSRFKLAVLLPHKESLLVKEVLLQLIKKHNIQSITFDNDLSFAKHYEFWVPTYFCHPYHSWEKGQIEKANAWWRRFFKKWSKLKNISQGELNYATTFLNHLPMKCLDWLTPREKQFSVTIRYLPNVS